MTVIIHRRTSRSAVWSRRLAIFAVVLLLMSAAGHRFGLVETPAFYPLLAIVAALAVVALLLACVGMFRLWEYGDRAGRAAALGAVLALLLLAPYGFVVLRALTLPQLTDISTDTMEAPVFAAAHALRVPLMNALGTFDRSRADLQAAAYPEVTGRRYALPIAGVETLVEDLLREKRWPVLGESGTQTGPEITLEAAGHTPIFGFVSDIAIRLTDEGETTYVDMRSASRFGPHDLGANAWLISTFLRDLDGLVLTRGADAPTAD